MPRRYLASRGLDLAALDDEERHLVEHLGAPLLVRELVLKTGLSAERLEAVIGRLTHLGFVIEAQGADEPLPNHAIAEVDAAAVTEVDDLDTTETALPPGVEPWSGEAMVEGVASVAPLARDPTDSTDDDTLFPEEEPFDEPPPSSEIPSSSDPRDVNYRHLYETELRSLDADARIAKAKTARDETLMAFCYDPDPKVIGAVMQNATFGLQHARAIAVHHQNARGLEILARRSDLLADGQVQQRLLKNPQLPDGVLKKIVGSKPLREVYKRAVDRNIPERTRSQIRVELRMHFTRADASERADLLIRTDGRVLLLLTGCTLDGRTTQMLCGKSTYTTLFIQSFARFGATPPQLLAKLIKLPATQRHPQLRAMLLRHPNLPSDLKRRF